MKSIRIAGISAALLFLAGCGGGFSPYSTGSGGSGGGGPFTGGGGGGSGGGGGGGGGGTGPQLVYQAPPGAYVWQSLFAGTGSRIVFRSHLDLVGSNSQGADQLFSFDLGTQTLTQVTAEPNQLGEEIDWFDITDSGDLAVFISDSDYTGANPSGFDQIFVANTDGTGVSQVTSFAQTRTVGDPQIAGDGSFIVFVSRDDLTGANPMLDHQIYSIDADGSNLTQVTTGNVVSQVGFAVDAALALSDDGSRIAFRSQSDPFGSNPDSNSEIFVINPDGTGHMQITSSDELSDEPRISDNGSLIALVSRGDLVAGGNIDNSLEVFVARADGTGITQISNSTLASGRFDNLERGSLDISGNGEYVVFESDADLTGENDRNLSMIYTARSDGTFLTQLLRLGVNIQFGSMDIDDPHISNDGSLILFQALSDYIGGQRPDTPKFYTIER